MKTILLLIVVLSFTGPASALPAQNNPAPLTLTRTLVVRDSAISDAVISWAMMAPGGSLVLARPADGDLVLLDERGRVVRKAGRRGAGPQEFARIGAGGWIADTLWIYDSGNRRINYFDRELRFLRSVPSPTATAQRPRNDARMWNLLSPRADLGERGWLYAVYPQPGGSTGSNRDELSGIARVDREGVLGRIVVQTPPDPCSLRTEVSGMPAQLRHPLCAAATTAVGPRGDYLVMMVPAAASTATGGGTITRFTAEGGRSWQRSLALATTRIPRSVRDSVIAGFGAPGTPPGMVDAAKKLPSPEWYPVLRSLISGRDGAVFVERWRTDARQEWIVLDPHGVVTGSILLAGGERLLAGSSHLAWVMRELDSGLQELIRYAF
ncbi:MAG: hypothetical protein U0974_13290 [Gemmatimonadales bacterium]|nr:hypothetical protein [Gemmatimonadales bacterium]MDZ4390694.1 hypothetical protein [Gemmatimonadales bacterium]